MRLVFAGTPEAAVPSLAALAASVHDVALVVTRHDAPLGRKRMLTPSPVAAAAQATGLEVLKTDRLDAAATERIAAAQPDLGVIVAYGGILREPLLSHPPLGWINLHFSLLPRWRGAAPVQRAVIAGDRATGAGVFRLVAELDAGEILAELELPIPPLATAGELLTTLADQGARLLADTVDALANGTARSRPQVGEPTYAHKLGLEDGRIRWNEPATAVLDRVRGTTPEPGAFTTIEDTRLKVLEARRAEHALALRPGQITTAGREVVVGTATEPVALVHVQPAGRGAMPAADWWRGLRREEAQADA
ncbi:methionyl-tRNA formyltransferase [Microbacterium sp. X-17]|uniref:methionyl-tRNA formyltransferase n=1 Tax=Microbacterium sp. X-17 TaxID=3144404 RepID=UPI0031F55D20